jgi:uncharacterized protein (TIGR00255 family)
MIRSMTGYGKAEAELPSRRIIVEIRTVNSKQLDLNLKLPAVFRDKEMDLRLLLSGRLERGKVDVTISVENVSGHTSFVLDKELAANYYKELKALSVELGVPEPDYLSILTRLPEVLKSGQEAPDEEEWKTVLHATEQAMKALDAFRMHEGSVIEKDFSERIALIQSKLKAIEPFENQRIISLKERIRKNLREFSEKENYDENRLEQELFYYIEKLDITEEKLRLLKHCDFFQHALSDKENNGKKLNFISQEIGREINTLGAKANDADIQKLIVEMKDELEKIKEQLLNIL